MRPRVLIVEDDPIQADMLAQLLAAHGYFPEVAENGRDAVRRLRAGMFDVALIDYRIPEIDGLGVARVIRNLEGLPRRPRLVALTSDAQALSADAAAFDAILAKPFACEALLQAIVGDVAATMAGEAPSPPPGAPFIGPGARPPQRPARGRGPILLADDDAQMRAFLKLMFEAARMEVDVAEDGLAAIRLMETRCYEVVVIDFRMPKLDGLAAAKIIFDRLGQQARPRIVALTSTPESLMATDPRWGLVLDAVVSKASGPQVILSVVQDCLDYKAARLDLPLEALGLSALAEMGALLAEAG